MEAPGPFSDMPGVVLIGFAALAAAGSGAPTPAEIGGGGPTVFDFTVHQITPPANTTETAARPMAVGWFIFTDQTSFLLREGTRGREP
jgi:hypothetical protein